MPCPTDLGAADQVIFAFFEKTQWQQDLRVSMTPLSWQRAALARHRKTCHIPDKIEAGARWRPESSICVIHE